MFAAVSSTPHTFSVFKYFALALLCPRESWSPTSTASRSRRRCRRKPVLPSALCVHSTHSRIQSSPHDSVPPHASLHRCCRELHHPDTICPRLCHDSKAAQPSSTTHSCPSSPKSLHPHSYTYHICTPDPLPSHTAPSRVVPQHLSTAALFPRLITSCTDVFIHVLAVPRIHDPFPPCSVILSQQQPREQPC